MKKREEIVEGVISGRVKNGDRCARVMRRSYVELFVINGDMSGQGARD